MTKLMYHQYPEANAYPLGEEAPQQEVDFHNFAYEQALLNRFGSPQQFEEALEIEKRHQSGEMLTPQELFTYVHFCNFKLWRDLRSKRKPQSQEEVRKTVRGSFTYVLPRVLAERIPVDELIVFSDPNVYRRLDADFHQQGNDELSHLIQQMCEARSFKVFKDYVGCCRKDIENALGINLSSAFDIKWKQR